MKEPEQKFTLRDLFVPLTTKKVIVFLFIIGSIVFFNCLFNGFVGDDNGQIVNNYSIFSLANIPTFFRISTFNLGNGISGMYYKPLLLTIYTMIGSTFGKSPLAFHSFQVFMYIINAVLVYLLFKRFIRQDLAFVLALIFLVHPINQETAAYISNLQDTVFFFFGMVGLLISTSKDSKYLDAKVLLMLVFSLLSKETGAVFFLINLVYLFLFRKKRFKKHIVWTAIIFIVYGVVHTMAVGTSFMTQHIYHIGRLPLLERLIDIPKIIYFYLFTFLYPKNTTVAYDWMVKSLNFSDFYFPLLAVLLFFGVLFFIGKHLLKNHDRFLVYVFFVLWFVLGLMPHLQIIPLDGTVATRWFYVPIVGLFGLTGIILEGLVKGKKSQFVFILISTIVIVLFSVRTMMRNTDFKDNLTLMCHDADVTHDNFSLENSCGISLYSLGKLDDAQARFERSISLAPYYGTNSFGLGVALGRKAEIYHDKNLYNRSVSALKDGIRLEPDIPWSYESLGYLYAHYEDINTAKIFLESSLKRFPYNYSLWLNYAYEEYKAGNSKTALQAITNAYKLNPNDPSTQQYYYDLSNNLPIKIDRNEI
jgi:protein O-mannosyl-transferase